MKNGKNYVAMLGTVGNVETKFAPSGTAITTFSLNVKTWRDKDNPDGEWFNAVAFGKTAEIARDYMGKGSKVEIDGYLKLDKWVDKQTGQKRSKPVIVVNELIIIDGKGGFKADEAKEADEPVVDEEDTDDLPF
jgi:single-strand DNA-binding protein